MTGFPLRYAALQRDLGNKRGSSLAFEGAVLEPEKYSIDAQYSVATHATVKK